MVYSFSSPTQPLDDKNVESVRFCTSPSFELYVYILPLLVAA